MKLRLTERLVRSYKTAPWQVQKAFDKQSLLLAGDLRHRSLHAKKYDEAKTDGRLASIRTGGSTSESTATRTASPS